MKSHARVVVLGGGIFGISVLYHLAREGWSDVVLVEKGELTSGTTWHAAGNVPHFVGDLGLARIHHYGTELYSRLEAETGQPTGWRRPGSIRLARNEAEMDWHRHVGGIARQVGFEFHLVGVDEIRKLHPYLATHDVVGGCHTPNDGYVDPASATSAMAAGARNRGAEIYRHTLATDIQRRGDEWELVTDKGNIACEHLVLAAGFFTPQVGAWLGLKVPTINMVHQYLITESIPELSRRSLELSVVRDPTSSSYFRQDQKGLLGGPYETEGAQFVYPDGVPWSFDHDLLEPELDRVTPWLDLMMKRIPLFAEAGIKRVIAGFIAHTPDLVPLVGPAPGHHKLWLACGAAIGIAQGAGCGKLLAELLVHGTTEVNPLPFDPRRFGDFHAQEFGRNRIVEATQHLFEYHAPGFEHHAPRDFRMSPLHGRLKRAGAVFGETFGWERPKWFAAPGMNETPNFRRSTAFDAVSRECKAVREKAGLLDLTSFAKFEIRGRDAEKMLNRIFANRMPTKFGGIVLAHILNDPGHIQAEATVTRLADDAFYVLTGASAEPRVADLLMQAKRPTEDVSIENITTQRGCLVLTGPRSRDILGRLTNADLGNDAFPWLTAREIEAGGVRSWALRVSYAGELGWELHCPIEETGKLYDALKQAGAEFGLTDFGLYALDALRMEKGYKGFGTELTPESTALEAGLDRFVDFEKGDFIGRDALLAQRAKSPRWRLVYMAIETTDRDVVGSEPVYARGKLVGTVTSGAFARSQGKTLAFAFVTPDCAAADTQLNVTMLGEDFPATVLAGPVYDSSNAKLRS
ncbi:MAG TPA: FAD-dependent oxidoreductase [Candidatus Polarisedimenticolia bacterium]|nr:FAD-dependent oxidoreductase [Candidatus Polarisedimenticolia bacterium]